MIPIRVLCHYDDGTKTMISIFVPEERKREDDQIEEVVLEMASATLEQMGKSENLIYMEVKNND